MGHPVCNHHVASNGNIHLVSLLTMCGFSLTSYEFIDYLFVHVVDLHAVCRGRGGPGRGREVDGAAVGAVVAARSGVDRLVGHVVVLKMPEDEKLL